MSTFTVCGSEIGKSLYDKIEDFKNFTMINYLCCSGFPERVSQNIADLTVEKNIDYDEIEVDLIMIRFTKIE